MMTKFNGAAISHIAASAIIGIVTGDVTYTLTWAIAGVCAICLHRFVWGAK